jgi:hypothetical protein
MDAQEQRFPWMDSQKLCSQHFLSAYIPVGDVVRGHDCMDAGVRAKQEAGSKSRGVRSSDFQGRDVVWGPMKAQLPRKAKPESPKRLFTASSHHCLGLCLRQRRYFGDFPRFVLTRFQFVYVC